MSIHKERFPWIDDIPKLLLEKAGLYMRDVKGGFPSTGRLTKHSTGEADGGTRVRNGSGYGNGDK
jgi:hypothetical protein